MFVSRKTKKYAFGVIKNILTIQNTVVFKLLQQHVLLLQSLLQFEMIKDLESIRDYDH